MICPECNGKGETKYYREVDRDEHSVTVEGFVDICHTCHGSGMKVQTNADHIRSMTDEELAKWLDEDIGCCCYCSEDERLKNEPLLKGEKCDEQCKKHLLDWLKQPYKEN